MCGIFGFFSSRLKLDEMLSARLESAGVALRHRGPDDFGVEAYSSSHSSREPYSLSLGHTRLSVIDLSSGGHQPMTSFDDRYSIVFNGEIYNYKELRIELESEGYDFKSDSDTEVLITAWSHWHVDALKRLIGMFAFVVYDKFEHTLTLVRDAFGIKPLYYWIGTNCLAFASEIPALNELVPKKIKPNWSTAYNYLTKAIVDRGEDTFYEGVKHVLPAHLVKFNLNNQEDAKCEKWWFPSIDERTDLSFNDASKILREKFLNNIKLHLRSDVPVGAALSGGIDSSAVVCAMRAVEPDMEINTFSYIAKGSKKNEERWVDLINEHIGAIPHKIEVNSDELFRDLERLIEKQGEPFGSSSIYAQYRVFKAARDAGIVVNLDGQGADEMLAGYYGYPHARISSLMSNFEIIKIYKLVKGLNENFKSSKLALILKSAFVIFAPRIIQHITKNRKLNSVINSEFYEKLCLTDSNYHKKSPTIPSNRHLVSELREALMGEKGLVHLLRYEDRNSMAHSIESRVPFLTTDIVEFLLSMPEEFLLSEDGLTKNIFRKAMEGLVPSVVLNRKDKIGFETPEFEWIKLHKELICSEINLSELPLINKKECINIVNNIANGRQQFSWIIWRIINLVYWFKINNLKKNHSKYLSKNITFNYEI